MCEDPPGEQAVKIYHNPRCSKSRQTLQLIVEAGLEPEVVEYLDAPPSAEELDQLLKRLGMEPRELMRSKEALYRELRLGERELSREEAIDVMVEHPRLIERPIVVRGTKAIIGRPPENVRSLLE